MSSLRSATTTSSYAGSGLSSSLRHSTFRKPSYTSFTRHNTIGNGGGRIKRWIQRLKVRRLEHATTFEKAYPDYILGDDIGPSQYDHNLSDMRHINGDATWTSKPAAISVRSINVGAPPVKADDEYVDFMRGKSAPRYMSFSEGIDLDTIDLTAPAKRRLSFRWSDVGGGRSGRIL